MRGPYMQRIPADASDARVQTANRGICIAPFGIVRCPFGPAQIALGLHPVGIILQCLRLSYAVRQMRVTIGADESVDQIEFNFDRALSVQSLPADMGANRQFPLSRHLLHVRVDEASEFHIVEKQTAVAGQLSAGVDDAGDALEFKLPVSSVSMRQLAAAAGRNWQLELK